MSGRFAKLKPSSKARKTFWNENVGEIRALLKEINKDVFDGEGKFSQRGFTGSYRKDPQLTEPYLFISFRYRGSLSVCTASTSKLRVIVELYSGMGSWKSWECAPESLADVLEIYVKLLVG